MTVDMQTGEVVQAHMSEASARDSVQRARTHLEAAADEVVRQINGKAWLALGYESWDEMREAEYAGAAVIVPRADRPQLVARLRGEGLSQREIGDTLGVSEGTISGDVRNLNSEDTDQPETRTDSLGRERPTTYTPRARDLSQDEPPQGDDAVEDTEAAPSVPDHDDIVDGEVVDELPPPDPEIQARLEAEAARESELRAARTNLRSVLTYLTSRSIPPGLLAEQEYGDVVHEFDAQDIGFAARTMEHLSEMRAGKS